MSTFLIAWQSSSSCFVSARAAEHTTANPVPSDRRVTGRAEKRSETQDALLALRRPAFSEAASAAGLRRQRRPLVDGSCAAARGSRPGCAPQPWTTAGPWCARLVLWPQMTLTHGREHSRGLSVTPVQDGRLLGPILEGHGRALLEEGPGSLPALGQPGSLLHISGGRWGGASAPTVWWP